MINNNTQQPQVVSTGQTTESTIYLKKSELPKNISTFRNDAGYISESSLELWLKSHSYLPKSEINNLIKQANLVVVDSINSTTDADAIQRLNASISGQSREIKEIKNRLFSVESGYIAVGDNKANIEKINDEIEVIKTSISNLESIEIPEQVNLDGYATEEWVKKQKFLKSQDLRDYVKASEIGSFIPPYPDLSGFANVEDIPTKLSELTDDIGYITSSSLKSYAKKTDIPSVPDVSKFITADDIPSIPNKVSELNNDRGYITSSSLKGYAKLTDIPPIPDVSKFITMSDIPSIPNKVSELTNDKGYITSSSLKGFARLTDIPSVPDVSRFITMEDIPTRVSQLLNDRGYIDINSLKGYAKKTDIPTIPDVSGFITREDIPDVPTKVSELTNDSGYITNGSLRGFARLTDIPSVPDVSKFITADDVPTKLSELTNDKGYVTNKDVDTYIKNKIPTIETGFVKSDYVDDRISLVNSRIDSVMGEIPSLDGYATQQWVEDKHYLTSHQSLSDYAKKKDLGDYVSIFQLESTLGDYAKTNSVYSKNYIDVELSKLLPKTDAEKIYVNKTDASKTYLSKKEALSSYLRIEDYRGIKDAITINSEYKEKTIDDLMEDIESIRNGFYIVHYNDMVVVKDHEVLQMFQDGIPSTIIEWKEEN